MIYNKIYMIYDKIYDMICYDIFTAIEFPRGGNGRYTFTKGETMHKQYKSPECTK